MNPALLFPEVQEFINQNLRNDISKILFRKSPFNDVSPQELAGQIESKSKSEKKLPTWFNTPGIYYPPKVSIEQASSEIAARYKSRLIKGNKILDITGGFGVDSFSFSKTAREVIHCEQNPELSKIAKHNADVLGLTNIRFIQQDGISYLKRTDEEFDTIYIDPSRRVNSQKVFKLIDCEPDVVSNLDLLLEKSPRIVIKTSPLLDIQAGLIELRQVGNIQVISFRNDCKELLWILERDTAADDDVQITCITLDPEKQYTFSLNEERNFKINSYSAPLNYIYEPDVALLKSGCFKLITRDFNVQKLHKNTHLYTSEVLFDEFMGRRFRLKAQWLYKEFRSLIPVLKANIICRNFPLSVDEVKRKSKLNDGGEEYLIFTTGPSDELLVLNCERL
ncbi:MAG TPA: RsmD family RNA methyltransferase [Sphingobacteriaceae bacterium]